MLSTTHSSIAIMILMLPIPFAWVLAIASHIAIDSIGEQTYPSWQRWQVGFTFTLLLMGLVTSTLPLVIGGIILGNLLDGVDKIIWTRLFKRQLIHEQPWYPKVILQLNGLQTWLIDLGLVLTTVWLISLV